MTKKLQLHGEGVVIEADDVQKRADRAELKVALGELSSARQALEGRRLRQAPGRRCSS